MRVRVVVPWYNPDQLELFLSAWAIDRGDSRFLFQQDISRDGCAITKNKGVQKAIEQGAEVVVVLDDDCFPEDRQTSTTLINDHVEALRPQKVEMFQTVTSPPSRGTPYYNRSIEMPVAASMGFWSCVGDYDAPGQLVHGAMTPMQFDRRPIFGRYFPLCGMNIAFRATEWPWCKFVNAGRFDDIWQGFLWQRKAYSDGKCFNLSGPIVKHSRQSNVWANLQTEAQNLEQNETIWKTIHEMPLGNHEEMSGSLGFKYDK